MELSEQRDSGDFLRSSLSSLSTPAQPSYFNLDFPVGIQGSYTVWEFMGFKCFPKMGGKKHWSTIEKCISRICSLYRCKNVPSVHPHLRFFIHQSNWSSYIHPSCRRNVL
ncbi:hypothetical protein CHARACLAT_019759 [Characodon lateralis]|uniref:Uncharacterized protein n=1 Tax=Characodon lateralis TaxID=208331 RepID=A0ABU7F7L0_9TELE|nr:hypothetical protein [Characodon lateralis]